LYINLFLFVVTNCIVLSLLRTMQIIPDTISQNKLLHGSNSIGSSISYENSLYLFSPNLCLNIIILEENFKFNTISFLLLIFELMK